MSEGRPYLEVQFRHRVGVLALDVAFALREPWSVLFGPSGGGKTTVLRTVAGFVRPQEGRLVLSVPEREFVMTDTARGICLKPHQRRVRTAGQGAPLFPHLTIRQNLAFGAGGWSDRVKTAAIVEESIERFRLQELAEKLPSTLSGGERHRVAIGRAAAAAMSVEEGCLLLLDEPFTGQDVALRDELIEELRGWLTSTRIPVLSVTHDVGEAFQLGAEVIKIADGRVVQQGPVTEVLAEERERLLDQLNASKGSPA